MGRFSASRSRVLDACPHISNVGTGIMAAYFDGELVVLDRETLFETCVKVEAPMLHPSQRHCMQKRMRFSACLR